MKIVNKDQSVRHITPLMTTAIFAVVLVNPCSGEEEKRITRESYEVHLRHLVADVSVGADGQYVLVSRFDTVDEWKLANREFVRRLPGHGFRMRLAADGRHALYYNDGSGKIDVLDLETGSVLETAVAMISPDEHIGLIRGENSSSPGHASLINIYESATRQESKSIGSLPQSEEQLPLSLSEHGHFLVALQRYRHLDVGKAMEMAVDVAGIPWTFRVAGLPSFASTPTPFGALPLRGFETLTLPVGASNSMAESVADMSSTDTRFVVWDVIHQRQVSTANVPDSFSLDRLSVSAGANLMIFENPDRSVDAIDLSTGKKRRLIRTDDCRLVCVQKPTTGVDPTHDSLTISHDGSKVAETNAYGAITIFDSSSSRVLLTLPEESNSNRNYSWFSADDRFLASRHGNVPHSVVRIWEVATGRLLFTGNQSVAGVAFTPNGAVVLAYNSRNTPVNTPVLHDLITGNEEPFAQIPDDVQRTNTN